MCKEWNPQSSRHIRVYRFSGIGNTEGAFPQFQLSLALLALVPFQFHHNFFFDAGADVTALAAWNLCFWTWCPLWWNAYCLAVSRPLYDVYDEHIFTLGKYRHSTTTSGVCPSQGEDPASCDSAFPPLKANSDSLGVMTEGVVVCRLYIQINWTGGWGWGYPLCHGEKMFFFMNECDLCVVPRWFRRTKENVLGFFRTCVLVRSLLGFAYTGFQFEVHADRWSLVVTWFDNSYLVPVDKDRSGQCDQSWRVPSTH